jgi:hypothetical protein
MPEPQPRESHVHRHISTNGVVVDHERWEWRKREAAEAVGRRYLTLREASEHYAVPEEEIAGSCLVIAH